MCFAAMITRYFLVLDKSIAVVKPATPALGICQLGHSVVIERGLTQ
jgi:hypothetical protein